MLSIAVQALLGQSPIGASENSLTEAFKLFHQEEYESVLQTLQRENGTVEVDYLIELSKLKLGEDNIDQVSALIRKNPKHALNSLANFSLGEYYFHANDSVASARSLRAVIGSDLAIPNRAKYYFMQGYWNVQNESYKKAESFLKRAALLANDYNPELTYYQGFIAYHLNKNDAAISHFDGVATHETYGPSSKFFLAKIRLEEGQYEEVITLGQSELSEEQTPINSAFHQLIGQAYAKQGEAQKASIYLERAIDLYPEQPPAALFYQAGVAKFKIGDQEKAISYFTEAGIRSGVYAKLSAFQLGRLYTSSGQLEKALSAYVEASSSEDQGIREESLFRAGKLNISVSNYAEGIKYLDDYRQEFKPGRWEKEANQLLAEAYLRTSNYDLALDHLAEVGVETAKQKNVFQKVAYQKALLLFNDGDVEKSIEWFNASLKYPINSTLADDAHFSLGEAYYTLSFYEMAIEAFKSQQKPALETWYGLGYAYYNLGEYEEVIQYFEVYARQGPKSKKKEDAKLRLADCYYAIKSYAEALTIYKAINDASSSSYSTYQIGIVQRNLNNQPAAISAFEKLARTEGDTLQDDASYQLAEMSFVGAAFERAESQYTSFINKFPTSARLSEAYMNRAISRTNLGKLEDAREDYEYVLNNHIQSSYALDALLGLQELQKKGVAVNNLHKLFDTYKVNNPDSQSLEVLEFEQAKVPYFNLDYPVASVAFLNFLDDYPASAYANEAKYFLGDSYYRSNELEKAETYFDQLRSIENNLQGRVLFRLGDIHFRLAKYSKAISSYTTLKSIGRTPKDLYNGRAGLMKAYFSKEQYRDCIAQADEIIEAEWQPLNAARNAALWKAKSHLMLNNSKKASGYFENIAGEADIISAEATYNLGFIAYQQEDYQGSLDLLFDLNKRFGTYTSWIDQSYLLVADNYIALDELFQAKATLRSIVQHTKDEVIREKAQLKLLGIENQALNDSIPDND